MAPRSGNLTIDWLDRAALITSFVCMVHCLGLPLLLAAVPTLSILGGVPDALHVWVLVLACPAAALALLHGRMVHRVWLPAVMGAIGLGLVSFGALGLDEGVAETVVTVGGSLLLASAHLLNWRLRRRCRD